MDFSKIKKIFYIVAIISILLSIKSKVFGASYDFTYQDTNYSLNIPDWISENNLNYSFYIYDLPSLSRHEFNLLVYDSSSIKLNEESYDNSLIYFTGNDIVSYDFGQGGNSFNEFMNEVNNYINTIVTFEDYNSSKTDHTSSTLKSHYYDSFIKETTAPIYKGDDIILDTTITNFKAPSFDNLTEIKKGYPDGVLISRGDYSENDSLYFHLLKITNTVPDGNQSTYYYQPKVFKLTKDSKYYKTYDADTENKYSYYFIDRSALTLDTNSSYLYVLSNSGDSITNSYGILEPDIPGGVYDVVQSDTAGVITEQQALNDKIANMNNNQQEFQQQQQEFQNQNSILPETETNIDTNLNFSNSAPQFSSLFNGFFSRLTSIISDLGNYKDSDVITVNLPIPYTNNTIPIRSDFIFSNQNNNFLKNITILLWYFIFGKYFLHFLINTYWLITTGEFFNYYLTQKEAITGDML